MTHDDLIKERANSAKRALAKTYEIQVYDYENDVYQHLQDVTSDWEEMLSKLQAKYPDQALRVILCVA